jgi:clan AA aspartic protease (TIGR02281 family)
MLMPIQLTLLCVLHLALSSNAFAQDIVTDCDKYAASDTDPSAKAPSIPLEKVNPALAVPACATAVQKFPNNPRLLFQLGRAYRAADNFKAAVEYYRKAAQQNYAAAQNSLGYAYANGQGIPVDDQRAIAWYRTAADQGLAAAQNNLGVMYAKGQGVPQDAQQAAAWFGKAAKQGLLSAQSNLDAIQGTSEVGQRWISADAQRRQVAEIARSRDGNFSVIGQINGSYIPFMVDTGASAVVLTQDAAKAAGLRLDSLEYFVDVETANGPARAAPIIVDRISVEGITERSVKALIVKPDGGLRINLLGMSFLNRLESWEVHGDTLIMHASP